MITHVAHVKAICKLLRGFAHRHDLYGLFSDCMEATAITISNSVDLVNREKREARYLEIVGRYGREVVDAFPKVLGEIVLALEAEPGDVLGAVYPSLSLINAAIWRRAAHTIWEPFYEEMVGTAECGPFDGGCVVLAQALQSVIGGDIFVLTRPSDLADHAAVYADGRLWDWDGPLPPPRFIERFNRNERTSSVSWRRMRDGDLPNAHRDSALVLRLAILLRSALLNVGAGRA